MKKRLLVLVQFLFLFHLSNGQKIDSLIGQYLDLAEINVDSAKFEKALEYNMLALDLAKRNLNDSDSIVGNIYTKLAFLYLEKNNYKIAYTYFDKTLQLRLQLNGPIARSVVKAYINLGFYNDELTYFDKAIAYYSKAWDILNVISIDKEDPLFSIIYNNLAICYGNKGDLEKAIIFFKKSLALDLSLYGDQHIDVAIDYQNIGSYYHDLKQFNLSLDFYNKSLLIYSVNLAKEHPKIISLYIAIGLNYYNLGEFETAMYYYDKGLIEVKKLGGVKFIEGLLYENIGDLLLAKNSFEEALSFYEKSKKNYNFFEDNYYPLAIVYTKTGILYAKQKNYKKALYYFQRAINSIDNSAKGAFSFEKARSPRYLLDIYQAQAKTLFSYFEVNRNSNFLLKADKISELAIQLIEFMKSGYREAASKQILLSDYYPIFEKAIEVKFKLWEITQDSIYLHQAFELAEKSKGSLLREAISKSNAEKFAGIPDTLLKQEESLKIDIAFYEKLLFEEEYNTKVPSTEHVNEINSKIFDLKLQYEELIQQFERDFPDYYQLKYDLKIRTVEQIRESVLDDHQGLIEYFVGDSTIFVFAIDQLNFDVIRLEKDFPLELWTQQLHNCISRYSIFSSKADSLRETYIDLSYQLYQKIFKPLLSYCPPHVIIIPDGVISYLPFEALLSKKPKDIYSFKSYDYLLKEYTISYSYSASLLSKKTKPKNEPDLRKSLLGFAPEFKPNNPYSVDRLDFNDLKYNIPEVESLQKMVGGTIYTGPDATENNFVKEASDYKILHLATHGKANDKVGDYSFLAFTEIEDSLENELLYVKDIYNLKLNADLVVLSACETAIGDLKRGEGMVSLARSFSYAGTPSILPTLWQISDAKAVQMMELFYENLQKGLPKDIAIRNAKLEYIRFNTNMTNHPFFWASFIIVGNTQKINLPIIETPIKEAKTSDNWWLALTMIPILFFLFLQRKRILNLLSLRQKV